jgi:hypothetical protein
VFDRGRELSGRDQARLDALVLENADLRERVARLELFARTLSVAGALVTPPPMTRTALVEPEARCEYVRPGEGLSL